MMFLSSTEPDLFLYTLISVSGTTDGLLNCIAYSDLVGTVYGTIISLRRLRRFASAS